MANLLDFYFEQLVLESDLDTLQANLQDADHKIMADQAYFGVVSGFSVSQHAPIPDLTVDVGGPGIAYDQEGQRIFMAATTTLDVSVDSNGASTAVVSPGNTKWVSVYVQFDRDTSDLRFDGNGLPVNYVNNESLSFVVVQGAESGAPSRPAFLPDAVLIADILLSQGQTQILDADIEAHDTIADPTTRHQFIFNLTGSSPAQVRTGRLPDVGQALLDELNNHINNVANPHPSDAIVFDPASLPIPSPPWANLQAATDVQGAFDAIVVDLADTTSGDDGALGVGFNISGNDWQTGELLVSTNVGSAIREVVGDLARNTALDGADRVGYDDSNISARYGVAGSIAEALDALGTNAAHLALNEDVTGAWEFQNNTRITADLTIEDGTFRHAPEDFDGGANWTFSGTLPGTVNPMRYLGENAQHTLTAGLSDYDIKIFDGTAAATVTTVGVARGNVLIWDDGSLPVQGTEFSFEVFFYHSAGIGTSVVVSGSGTPFGAQYDLPAGAASDLTGFFFQTPANGQLLLNLGFGANAGAIRNISADWTLRFFATGQ